MFYHDLGFVCFGFLVGWGMGINGAHIDGAGLVLVGFWLLGVRDRCVEVWRRRCLG